LGDGPEQQATVGVMIEAKTARANQLTVINTIVAE
jgi:hypothetical protein